MEPLKHECGMAATSVPKPLEYYQQMHGTWMYGLNKPYFLLEKQPNRGQESAGLACGHDRFKQLTPVRRHDVDFAGISLPFVGTHDMGHLRYSTTGKSGLSFVRTFVRRGNLHAGRPVSGGNFNLTNVGKAFVHYDENDRISIRYNLYPVFLQ